MDAIERIARKLDQLRRADRELRIFGAEVHQYRLRTTLKDKELLTFERKHAIELPDDYRSFVSLLGNGGAGPFHGVFQLGGFDDDEAWPTGLVSTLSDAFPHKKKWNLSATKMELEEEAYYDPALMAGAFPICHHGCALRSWLVVSGAERGRVWYDGRADGDGIWPQTDAHGKPLSFAAWYETWLDESLAELKKKSPRSG
jgi:hypothetical protein